MISPRRSRALALAALCLMSPLAAAKKPRDIDADRAVMRTLPVYLLVAEGPLRGTVPLLVDGRDQTAASQAARRAVAVYGNVLAGASNTGFGAMFMTKLVNSRSINLVVPPMRTLRDAGCLVDEGDALAQSVANIIRAAPGLAEARFVQTDSHQAVRDIPRIQVIASSGFTPDFAAIITTYAIEVYSPDMPKAPFSWKAQPSLQYDFAVVSDAIDPPTLAGTSAATSPTDEEDGEDDGSTGKWKLPATTARRARVWAEGSCRRVHEALASNKAEAGRLLAQALVGQVPTELEDDYDGGVLFGKPRRNLPTDPAGLAQRRLYSDVGMRRGVAKDVHVSRRAGDNVMIDFRFAWIPGDYDAEYDRLHAEGADTRVKPD